MTSPITPPVARLNNLSIESQYFTPSVYRISGITTGVQTIVQTSSDHNYVLGQQVRIYIPPYYGIRELDGQQGTVIDIPSATEVALNINSQNYSAFIDKGLSTVPQITAIGDVNSGAINSSRTGQQTYINGSFINISP